MRDSILLYRSQLEALLQLDAETCKETLKAFYDYGMNEAEPTCTSTALALFIAFKPLIDKNNSLYENGRKGGRPKSNQKPNDNQTITKAKPTDNQTVTQMINDKCKMLNDKEKDILSGKPDPAPVYPYREVIEYLNSKIGTSYKVSSKDTRKHIKARFDEGYTLEDFQKVIDNKVSEWGKDPDMVKYLRPATLFGTKFESYLNQKTVSGGDRKNQFNRFHQREYDFESLERDLLRAEQ